jgi:hypothetical protein
MYCGALTPTHLAEENRMPSYLIEVDQFDQLALELARRKDPEVVVAVFKSRGRYEVLTVPSVVEYDMRDAS